MPSIKIIKAKGENGLGGGNGTVKGGRVGGGGQISGRNASIRKTTVEEMSPRETKSEGLTIVNDTHFDQKPFTSFPLQYLFSTIEYH